MQGQAPWWKVSAAKKHFLARREAKNTAFVVQDLKTTTDNIHIILYRLPYHNRPSSACWESSCLQEPWCLLSNLVLNFYQVQGAEYQWFSDAKSSKPKKTQLFVDFHVFFVQSCWFWTIRFWECVSQVGNPALPGLCMSCSLGRH